MSQFIARGVIRRGEATVLVLTGSGLKASEKIGELLNVRDRHSGAHNSGNLGDRRGVLDGGANGPWPVSRRFSSPWGFLATLHFLDNRRSVT